MQKKPSKLILKKKSPKNQNLSKKVLPLSTKKKRLLSEEELNLATGLFVNGVSDLTGFPIEKRPTLEELADRSLEASQIFYRRLEKFENE